ncbi:MAG TPA: thioesterase family protein [Candidatus Limnocylindrales bacterium]|nr:thioesterase family protein [Candidatus Limnocylindrales bacterium]
MPPTESAFVSETAFNVRYAETDAMGIVHHASHIVYFEEGRSAYARARGASYADFERTGHYLVVAEVQARFIKAARYDQRLVVRTWVGEFKSRGVRFEYEIRAEDSGELLVTGATRHICITREGRPARLPVAWLAWGNS